MKLPEVNELINLWPKSLPFLKDSVIEYFRKNDIPVDNVWFPDIEILLPEMLATRENIQVVLFGGFLERIFESGNWHDKKFSFWCLSPNVKKVMTELLNFPENSINVIPRYEFMAKASVERPLDLNSDIQIIYSGRLSSQKNIEMVLAFTSLLQEKTDKNVSLLLLGEWGNQPPKHRGRFVIDSYKDVVEKFQQRLQFKSVPKVISTLGHSDWLSVVEKNSVLVNFSTYVHEDFGVAVAQAQHSGMPMILSKWGGHNEVSGNNILFVDTQDIGESLTSDENILLKAQIVVEKLLADKLIKKPAGPDYKKNSKIEFIDREKMSQIRLTAMNEHGYGLSLTGQGWLTLFADSKEGREFFKKYSQVFRGEAL